MIIDYGTNDIKHLSTQDQTILLARGVNPPKFNTEDICALSSEGQAWVIQAVYELGYYQAITEVSEDETNFN